MIWSQNYIFLHIPMNISEIFRFNLAKSAKSKYSKSIPEQFFTLKLMNLWKYISKSHVIKPKQCSAKFNIRKNGKIWPKWTLVWRIGGGRNLSMQFLKAWERADATSSESPGATQSPDATTSSKKGFPRKV